MMQGQMDQQKLSRPSGAQTTGRSAPLLSLACVRMPRAEPLPGPPPAAEGTETPQGAAAGRPRPVALALWAGVALGYAALGLGLWWCLRQLYFGAASSSCRPSDEVAAGWSEEAQWLDTALGALPILLRNCLLLWLLWKACRKLSGYESDEAHVARDLLLGGGSTLGNAPEAGWDSIVGPSGGDDAVERRCGGVR